AGVNTVNIGVVLCAGPDAAALIERDADRVEAEPSGVGHTTDGDEHHNSLHHHGRSAGGGLDLDRHRPPGRIRPRGRRAEFEAHALLGEYALELARDLAVHTGHDAVEKFDDRDFCAEPAPDRAELQPDDAAADDKKPARHLVEFERPGRRDDPLLVDIDAL